MRYTYTASKTCYLQSNNYALKWSKVIQGCIIKSKENEYALNDFQDIIFNVRVLSNFSRSFKSSALRYTCTNYITQVT